MPTITWMTVFVALPPYLRNNHLPVTGPFESHYPWSNRRWQGKEMARTNARWQVLSVVPPSCLQGGDSQPLLESTQWIHRATNVIRALQHQTRGFCSLLCKATYLLTDVLLEGQPTSCVQDNIQVTRGWKKASWHTSHMPHVPWHLDMMFLLYRGGICDLFSQHFNLQQSTLYVKIIYGSNVV